jgi:hypothetical protein
MVEFTKEVVVTNILPFINYTMTNSKKGVEFLLPVNKKINFGESVTLTFYSHSEIKETRRQWKVGNKWVSN